MSQVPWLASGAQGDVLFSVARITDQGMDDRREGYLLEQKIEHKLPLFYIYDLNQETRLITSRVVTKTDSDA